MRMTEPISKHGKSWSFAEFFSTVKQDAREKGIPIDDMIDPDIATTAAVLFRDDLSGEEIRKKRLRKNPNKFINLSKVEDGYTCYTVARNKDEVIIVDPRTEERYYSRCDNIAKGNEHGEPIEGWKPRNAGGWRGTGYPGPCTEEGYLPYDNGNLPYNAVEDSYGPSRRSSEIPSDGTMPGYINDCGSYFDKCH
jgi:hypothetical protein